MNFLSLMGVEAGKLRRSKIVLILAAAVVVLWLPSIYNVHLNFQMQDIGISPEHNFLIQGIMGMAWFMFPASMIVSTVLINITEKNNNGILKMLSLPVNTANLCMVKFVILLALAALQMIMMVGMYYISAAIVSHTQNYDFILSPALVFKEAAFMFLSAIPMLAFFWVLSVCIQTPIFSMGIALASIVPSVLVINTKAWFAYPMAYPFYIVIQEYAKLAENMETTPVALVPWLPAAIGVTVVCLIISCLRFGQAERR